MDCLGLTLASWKRQKCGWFGTMLEILFTNSRRSGTFWDQGREQDFCLGEVNFLLHLDKGGGGRRKISSLWGESISLRYIPHVSLHITHPWKENVNLWMRDMKSWPGFIEDPFWSYTSDQISSPWWNLGDLSHLEHLTDQIAGTVANYHLTLAGLTAGSCMHKQVC